MIAVISDIHANLIALNEALDIINKRDVKRLFVCGDTVGYGYQPNECCELVRSLGCEVVLAGNHDWAVCGNLDYSDFSHEAKESTERTIKDVSEENKQWLKSLPLTYQTQDMVFVHATLVTPEKFYYPVIGTNAFEPLQDVGKTFKKMKGNVCFVGHSHQASAFIEKSSGKIKCVAANNVIQLNGCKAVLDVGSVGYPRCASDKACVVFYDEEQEKAEFVRFHWSTRRTKSIKAWDW
jgi:predicted phosphodiesterase